MATAKSVAGEAAERPRYHHGDLHAALLQAAEAELTEHGYERLSLRGIAKRAGVSHAAPAHHFGDKSGLLRALATVGFRRFIATQEARQREAAPDPRAQLTASGFGYIDFAMESPALFRLMFSSQKPAGTATELETVATAAYDKLVADVRRLYGEEPPPEELMQTVSLAWAVVHGLADLMNGGRMRYLLEMPPEQRRKTIEAITTRAFSAIPG